MASAVLPPSSTPLHSLHTLVQDHLVLSGDKGGQIAVWDWSKVGDRPVHRRRWLAWTCFGAHATPVAGDVVLVCECTLLLAPSPVQVYERTVYTDLNRW